MGMDAYRFSIAWSRIFPNGSGEINQAGVDHYNNLINALLANGIEPYLTFYHWDLPQALADKYKGWLDPQIIDMLSEVRGPSDWITFNEPHTFAIQGYDVGIQAPGRCSIFLRLFCRAGNSATEPYIIGHHVLLSHATAFDIYRKKYKRKQHGSVGITLNVIWFEPMTDSNKDFEAAQRAQDFQSGWTFLEQQLFLFGINAPGNVFSTDTHYSVLHQCYITVFGTTVLWGISKLNESRVGRRLPTFSRAEAALVKGSLDFVGINHYTTYYAKDNSTDIIDLLLNDTLADPAWKHGKAIGERASSIWLYIVPEGIRKLMNYIKLKYRNPTVIITENGMDDANNPLISIKKALMDQKRIKYHNDYLTNLLASIKYVINYLIMAENSSNQLRTRLNHSHT
uniref:Beta-glucosidase 40-like n=1 Tax=Nelumbo nucifera TaxID=4432 RepID=A0A822YV81_NELNU|nr:TPA_asm: hypothetical protein HUJ06_005655 [Nelumbo nucifera]